MATYYPLTVGNTWKYKQQDGTTFTNEVTGGDPQLGRFTIKNSTQPKPTNCRKEGSSYHTDGFEEGNFQVFLRDDLKVGDSWDIRFKANGIDSVLVMKVKEQGGSLTVEGKSYNDVVQIEGESKMIFNGNLMPLNFLTQWYYAAGVGLVLTTSTGNVSMPLIDSNVK